ncbi:MAG TPA: MBL fold metallo-hydrolase [Solirubrobacterales bacterium]|jgi:glyoxylase-like metal-dependent hydrolase (beta-lactamase superfamily II)|nr:MBL fold metallo-hydrolase [Solirubrobacterales bacterium]
MPARPNGSTATRLRVLRPAPGVLAFYDGRVPGYRFAPRPNWIDEGALALGTACFAIVEGDEALVYDTRTTPEHGREVRAALEAEGVGRFTVLLSHWHLDHVAGNSAFADCEVIATARTAELLARHRDAIEAGAHEGPPGICPLVLPTRTFEGRTELRVGERRLEAIPVNVHSDDAAVLWDPEARLLLAGDTVEDTVTYVEEPENFEEHLRDLDRLLALKPTAILPSHGDPEAIESGGYSRDLITATEDYIRLLQRMPDEPELRELPLRELLARQLAAGDLRYFEPYERVHRENVQTVLDAA